MTVSGRENDTDGSVVRGCASLVSFLRLWYSCGITTTYYFDIVSEKVFFIRNIQYCGYYWSIIYTIVVASASVAVAVVVMLLLFL